MANFNVSLKKLTEKVSLDVVYTPKGLEEINVEIAEVNRPGLFLAGYYDYFDKLRLQILGLAEMNFLSGLSAEKRYERLDQLFGQQPPAVIVCRSEELEPFPEMLELAQKHGVALLRSNEITCTLMGSLISVLNLELAPRITRHGVLVEVYGEGILILGDSGIGKSELAIELVKRATVWWRTTRWSCARSPTARSWARLRRISAILSSCAASASSMWPVCSAWVRSRRARAWTLWSSWKHGTPPRTISEPDWRANITRFWA